MATPSKSLEDVFKDFCGFGGKDAAPMMDNAKFAKMCRDLKILDKNLTATDVDIIFSKVKAKTERKISYTEFNEAVTLMAKKKYPGDASGVGKLTAKMTSGKGPQVHGVTKPQISPLLDRMTDTSKYTGTHKERFDESGKGKGLAGRESLQKGAGMSPSSLCNHSGYVSGYKHEGTYEKKVKK